MCRGLGGSHLRDHPLRGAPGSPLGRRAAAVSVPFYNMGPPVGCLGSRRGASAVRLNCGSRALPGTPPIAISCSFRAMLSVSPALAPLTANPRWTTPKSQSDPLTHHPTGPPSRRIRHKRCRCVRRSHGSAGKGRPGLSTSSWTGFRDPPNGPWAVQHACICPALPAAIRASIVHGISGRRARPPVP